MYHETKTDNRKHGMPKGTVFVSIMTNTDVRTEIILIIIKKTIEKL